MIYALRKLIAFVFLGGMFWFIYQDLDNLDKPWFMHALGMITIAFAVFWLLIPMLVVRWRIHRRCMQNRERYARWKAEHGEGKPRPFRKQGIQLTLEPGEQVYFHEKGTMYATKGAGVGEIVRSRAGRPSDVAFPNFSRTCSRVQRTHCYMTDRRLLFVGKELFKPVPYAQLKSVSVTPGGLVFHVARAGQDARIAFTFQNPLIADDILRAARKDDK